MATTAAPSSATVAAPGSSPASASASISASASASASTSTSTAYISIGANRSSSCGVTTASGLFVYGAGSTLAVWDTTTPGGVHATLLGHRGEVTTLKQIPGGGLVSGDSLGEIRIWTAAADGKTYTCAGDFFAHKGASISAIGVVPSPQGVEIITGGSDGNVIRWRIGSSVEEVERLDLRGRLSLDLEAALLPGSGVPVLVVGCTDWKVQVWTLVDDKFKHMLSLEGHEDWVRCLALTPWGDSLLLATGAQDNYVRLWRIAPAGSGSAGLDLLDEFEQRIGDQRNVQLSTKAHVLSVSDNGVSRRFNVTLEALLVGHESGLTNVHWSPHEHPLLLSSAADNSLIIWAPTEGSGTKDGMWVPEHRFGSLGGRGLAFFGAVWDASGDTVIGTGWTGGVERWIRKDAGWAAAPGLTGHFGPVQSVAWDPRGDYLLSTSSDQTSRVHAACKSAASAAAASVWAEIARPQIHGYDLVDAAFLSPFRFASAAEEKVMRVFDATGGFAGSLRGLGVCAVSAEDESALPVGATVPPLGLSNRALGKNMTEPEIKTMNESRDSVSVSLTTLPTEEELNTSTLWPEIEKIYGHGYELSTLAASNAGDMVATASRASSAEHAVVRVVSASTWGLLGAPLAGHSLTVTRIAFSPDDAHVLTVSRDRGWRLFSRAAQGYEPCAEEPRAHARMVLDCAWLSAASFVTASRDKSAKIWVKNDTWAVAHTITLKEAVTSVAVAASEGLIALGTESGAVEIHAFADGKVTPLTSVPAAQRHAGAVTRLAWSGRMLASAGEDRAVRVFGVTA